ncbi:hypothetical protein WME73_29310 [Sorangium sp. So ce302]|uniref:hypothetical protein n=1 Tax=unclassified Sorangium TaxID=2621164 RepID=UPI003F5E23A6
MVRRLVGLLVLGLVAGCDGTTTLSPGEEEATNDGSSSASGGTGGGSAGTPGVGPIDEAALPTRLPMSCGGGRTSLSFALPCHVGLSLLSGEDEPGHHVVECELADFSGTAVAFSLPLVELPRLLNQPVQLPFDAFAPPSGPGAMIDGERFVGTLEGTATVRQVDLKGRAFVADLQKGHVAWTGEQGSQFECNTIDGPLWAVAGNFL